jgi:hypothetical protein
MELFENDELSERDLDSILQAWDIPQAPAHLRATVFAKPALPDARSHFSAAGEPARYDYHDREPAAKSAVETVEDRKYENLSRTDAFRRLPGVHTDNNSRLRSGDY